MGTDKEKPPKLNISFYPPTRRQQEQQEEPYSGLTDPDKELYRLWFECLRRSEKYKEFCSLLRENPEKATSEYQGSWFSELFHLFAMIHDFRDFEEWWVYQCEYLNRKAAKSKWYDNNFPPCKAYSEDTLRELISQLRDPMEEDEDYPNPNLFVEINLSWTLTEIKNAISDLLRSDLIQSRMKKCRRVYKAAQNRELAQWRALEGEPISRNMVGNPKFLTKYSEYLRIFDLWRKYVEPDGEERQQGWRKVLECVGVPVDEQDPDVLRRYTRHLEKAKKLIANIEEGVFPGDLT